MLEEINTMFYSKDCIASFGTAATRTEKPSYKTFGGTYMNPELQFNSF